LKISDFFEASVLPHPGNDGMVEYWKVEDPVFSGIVFKRKYFINKLPCQSRSQRDQQTIIPISQELSFQYSNIPLGATPLSSTD
jgi:hypothetical protein